MHSHYGLWLARILTILARSIWLGRWSWRAPWAPIANLEPSCPTTESIHCWIRLHKRQIRADSANSTTGSKKRISSLRARDADGNALECARRTDGAARAEHAVIPRGVRWQIDRLGSSLGGRASRASLEHALRLGGTVVDQVSQESPAPSSAPTGRNPQPGALPDVLPWHLDGDAQLDDGPASWVSFNKPHEMA